MADYTLNKSQRLYGQTTIDNFFKNKKKVIATPPLLIFYSKKNAGETARAMFIVRKKNLKHATDRNLIKRFIREAYRHNKPQCAVNIAIIFNSSNIDDRFLIKETIEQAMKKIDSK